MPRAKSVALPTAYVVLRLLIALNWFYGACLLALLTFSFVNEPFLMKRWPVSGCFKMPPSPRTASVIRKFLTSRL